MKLTRPRFSADAVQDSGEGAEGGDRGEEPAGPGHAEEGSGAQQREVRKGGLLHFWARRSTSLSVPGLATARPPALTPDPPAAASRGPGRPSAALPASNYR